MEVAKEVSDRCGKGWFCSLYPAVIECLHVNYVSMHARLYSIKCSAVFQKNNLPLNL